MPNSQDKANAKLLTMALFKRVSKVEAATAGIHQDLLSSLRKGVYLATLTELIALARIRNVSIGQLIKAAEERIAL